MNAARAFIAEYVDPAIEIYRKNRLEKHLAAHAIAQVDILAEVVSFEVEGKGRTSLSRGEAGKFRDGLEIREPILAVIRDAHDSHKHGELTRNSALLVSMGQRPETKTERGFFANHSFVDGLPIEYDVLILRFYNGGEREIFELLIEARSTWERELAHHGF